MNYILSDVSRSHLQGVHPDLVRLVERAIQITGVDFRVTCGLRTMAQQEQALQQGNSWTLKSRHLTGHAVDLTALDAHQQLSYDTGLYPPIAVAMRQAAIENGIGVVWGAAWNRDLRKFKDPMAANADYRFWCRARFRKPKIDMPHFELPFSSYPVPK